MTADVLAATEEPAAAPDKREEGTSGTPEEKTTSKRRPSLARRDDPIDASDRTIPEESARALYGVHGSDLGGPSAFGHGATAVGILNLSAEPPRSARFQTQPVSRPRSACPAFVPTATHGEIRAQLQQRSVVYLGGLRGTGRVTAAQMALADHGSGRVAHIALSADARLEEVLGDQGLLREEYGHLLVIQEDEPQLDRLVLATLEGVADSRRATVVLVGTAGREVSHYLVPHAAPAAADVFTSWLGYELRRLGRCVGSCVTCEGDCVDAYVNQALVDVGQHLAGTGELGATVHLAREIARERPDADGCVRLLGQLGIGLRPRAEEMLRPVVTGSGVRMRRISQHQQAFRLSYAVLDGRPLTDVFVATGSLMDQLDDALGRPRGGRSVFELDVDALLGPGVRNDSPTPAASHVAGSAKTARLREPRITDHLLDVAWNDYDSARAPILNWFKALVEGNCAWSSVAAAAGRLCAYDVNEVCRKLIYPWANSSSAVERQAAAIACESAAFNEHLTRPMLSTVRSWAGSGSSNRRDTAARTYATRLFSRRFADFALIDLELVARDRQQLSEDSVAWAIQQLYRKDNAREVVSMIRNWTASPLPQLRGQADRCLIALARKYADAAGRQPALLDHLDQNLIQPSDLAPLWRSALRQPTTSADAWNVLAHWIERAESHEKLEPLVIEVFREPALRTRARFYTTHLWRRRMPANPFLAKLMTIMEE